MIYRFTFLLVFAFCASIVFSQPGNLVVNPSFEDRVECIYNDGSVEQAPPWYSPTAATPDVFHECAVQLEDPCPYPNQVYLDPWFFGIPTNTFGCQVSKSGAGYAGLFLFGPIYPDNHKREYLGVPLSETLTAGQTYLVRFFVSLSERSMYAVYALQVLFTPQAISEPLNWGVLDYTPQLSHTEGGYITDKDNWIELSWEYTSDGTEQYMYIGNFQSNAVIDTIYVLPDTTSSLSHFESYYFVDDVYVGTEALSVKAEEKFGFEIWPNPVDEILSVNTHTPIQSLCVYSIQGAMLYQNNGSWSARLDIDISAFAPGVYVITASDIHGNMANQKIVKR